MKKHPVPVLITGILGISVSSIIVKLSDAPSLVTAAYRLLWTVLLMTPSVLLDPGTRKEMRRLPKRTLLLSLLSGLMLAVHFSTWFESLRFTTVASSTVIVCTEVIWVALGYCLFMGGKVSFREAAAIAAAFLGSAVIALGDSGGQKGNLKGDLLSLIAAVAVGIYTLLGREVRKETGNAVYTYVCYCSCAAVLTCAVLLSGQRLFGYGWRSLLCGLLLSVCSTILGHSIFSWCLRFWSPAFVSASKLCEPVISSLIAIPVFRELPTLSQILGGALVLAGVVYYTVIEIKEEEK